MIKLLFSFYHQINILTNNYMDNVLKKKKTKKRCISSYENETSATF